MQTLEQITGYGVARTAGNKPSRRLPHYGPLLVENAFYI